MPNVVDQMPPIPIFILFTLILIWIAPLLYTRIVKSLGPRGGRLPGLNKEPRTALAARRSFYWTLFLTGMWAILFLAANHKHSELERGMNGLFAALWFFFTILRYRQWRRISAHGGSGEKPNII